MSQVRILSSRPFFCGCSSLVEPQPSKLMRRVRFPSPAPVFIVTKNIVLGHFFSKTESTIFLPLDKNLFGGLFSAVLPSVFREEECRWSPCINSVCFCHRTNRCVKYVKRQGPERVIAQAPGVSRTSIQHYSCFDFGRWTVNSVPWPTALSTSIEPLPRSIAWRTRERPSPVPPTSRLRALFTR